MLALILTGVGGALAGAVVALKVIAPKTKTSKDDKILEILAKVEVLYGIVVKNLQK